MTELLNLNCKKTNAPISTHQSVYVKNLQGIIIGWGWFEWEEDLRRFWFREDITNLLPSGMDAYTIENIFTFNFELP